MTEFIEPVMKWIVVPIVTVVLWLARKLQKNEEQQSEFNTELKILEAKLESQTQSSKDNHEALRVTMGQVLSRLDSIDGYLRKANGHD